MADDNVTEKKEADAVPRFVIKGQYIKDLSFENPHAPHTLLKPEDKPRLEVSVALKAQRFNDEHFEVTLNIITHCMGKENILFLAEIDYAAIVQLINVPEENMEPILFIECATVLFPFARRVLADITRDGGFQPMMLDPVDFAALYEYNKRNQAKAAG